MLIRRIISACLMLMIVGFAYAQKPADVPEDYWNTITQRSQKIVDEIPGLSEDQSKELVEKIRYQYYSINKVYDEFDPKFEGADSKKKANLEDKRFKKTEKLNKKFIASLGKTASPEQVDAVKDGMTYSLFHVTSKAYFDMLPDLTPAQKEFIEKSLREARDNAMHTGSSKEKHGWFGKYKGRINNYLSQEGVDLQEARKGWMERIENEKAK